MSVPEALRTAQLPSFCSAFFSGEKLAISAMGRAPTTIWASRARIGATSAGMSAAQYWLSASVLTTTSAPSASASSSPAMKARASPTLQPITST